MPKEIQNIDDIRLLVDLFYSKVNDDELLSPVFNAKVNGRWPEHLEKMYRFWQTILLEEHTYSGSPFPPHAKLPIGKEYFDRWLFLFNETLDEHFTGEKAKEAKWRAEKMGEMFLYKIEYFRDNPDKLML